MAHNMRIIRFEHIKDVKREMELIGSDPGGIERMAEKAVHRAIKVEKVNVKAANILKQTMLAKGGEASVHRGVADFSAEYSDVLLLGTIRQFQNAIGQLSLQPWGLRGIARQLSELLAQDGANSRCYQWGEKQLELGKKTLVMGVLNVTPDSFSDGGKYNDLSLAVEHAHKMVEDGADIIDLGGESTRPYGGNKPISAEEETARVLPILERLVKELPVPVSLDTYKAETAREALKIGVHMINDVWGLQKDPDMASVVEEYKVPVIVMHNKTEPGYRDLLGEITAFLRQSIQIAEAVGIPKNNVIIDPGIGFAKTRVDNLVVMRRLKELQALGCPVLLGTSRKAFIGSTLDLPPEERVEGTAATVAFGIANGADIVRVHDVKEMVRVARMTDALLREEVD